VVRLARGVADFGLGRGLDFDFDFVFAMFVQSDELFVSSLRDSVPSRRHIPTACALGCILAPLRG
jgi:hypothetical protein